MPPACVRFGPIADKRGCGRIVRFVPIADIQEFGSRQKMSRYALFLVMALTAVLSLVFR